MFDQQDMATATAVLPNLDHLSMVDYNHIYEPAEDTFLACDALLQERGFLETLRPMIVMEIGSGSGCIITYLSKLLEDIGIWSIGFATDINPHANLCTLRTAKQNNIQNLEVIQCNFAAPVKEKLQGKIDVLVFNPPYVPTPNDEVGRNDIAASWAGGDDGRVVIDRFLPNIPFLLSKSGVCYMVLVQENKPEELCRIIQDKYRLSMSIVKRYKARNEQLMIVKIVHMASNEFGSMIV